MLDHVLVSQYPQVFHLAAAVLVVPVVVPAVKEKISLNLKPLTRKSEVFF